MIRMTGHDYRLFEQEPWPEGWWVEEVEFTVNGVPTDGGDFPDVKTIKDDDIVTVNGGYILGSEDAEVRPPEHTYERVVKQWKGRLNTRTMLISCGLDDLDAVVAAIKKAKGKVILS